MKRNPVKKRLARARRKRMRDVVSKAVVATAAKASARRPTAPSIKPKGGLPGVTQQQGSDAVGGFGAIQLFSGERQPELIGDNLWRHLTNMLASTVIIASAVRYTMNLLGGVEWESSPNPRSTDTGLAKACAETVRWGLLEADMDQPWEAHVQKQGMHAYYGYALHNWFFRKRSDGLIVYSDLRHRPQHTIKRWDIPTEGDPWEGVEQHTRQGGLYYIERSRLWYTADLTLTDHPVGVGLLRHCVQHAANLARFEQLEGYAYDANLRGIPIGRAPLDALWNQGKNLKKADPDAYVDEQTAELQSFLTNHIKTPEQGLLLDSAVYQSGASPNTQFSSVPQWAVELLQGDDMGLSQIAVTIERVNREIARVLSFEWAMLGDGDAGSNAMHVDKTAQYGAFVNGIVRRLAVTARNDLARPLVARNHGPKATEENTPVLTPSKIGTEALREITGAIYDMKMGGAFIPPDDPVWAMIRKRMGAPPPMKIPPDIRGALMPVPRDPNDPNNPDNGGDGDPGDDEDATDTDNAGEDGGDDNTDPDALRKPEGGKAPPKKAPPTSKRKPRRTPRLAA